VTEEEAGGEASSEEAREEALAAIEIPISPALRAPESFAPSPGLRREEEREGGRRMRGERYD